MPAAKFTTTIDATVARKRSLVKAARGTCAVCMKRHELRKSDGMLVTHKHLTTKCTGSYTAPVEAAFAEPLPNHHEIEKILVAETDAVLAELPKRPASEHPKAVQAKRALKSVPAQTSRDRSSDLISVEAARAEFPTLAIVATVSGRFPHLAVEHQITLCKGMIKQGRTAPVLDQGMCPNCTRVARKL